jgi:hypothetical protein
MKKLIILLAVAFCLNSTVHAQVVPANIQAASCADVSNTADCQMWIEGFADTIGMIAASNNNSLCPGTNVGDLYAEFEQKAAGSSEDTRKFLIAMIGKTHICKTPTNTQLSLLSAGDLMDVADTGDIGFEMASQYQKGFLDLIVFLQERPDVHVFCGNNAILGTQLEFAHKQVTADYKLRQEPASVLLFNALRRQMPCGN